MRIVAFAGVVLGAIGVSLVPVAAAMYEGAFPTDAARRVALDSCARSDPGFKRLLAAARRDCYHRSLDAGRARPGAWPISPTA